ncbi:MAG: CinA family protein [Candidatus Cryosericum sp.]
MILEVGADLEELAARLLKAVAKKRWHIGTAESLTGGMLGETITAVPGASVCYVGGIVSYSDHAKMVLLGVPTGVLSECGAVSAEVATAMAQGCRGRLAVQIALATTGVAGPTSNDRGTPVGTVFVACATAGSCVTRRLLLAGERNYIRLESTRAALELGIQLAEEEA